MKNKEIQFAEWLAENHYVLNNIQDGIHYWENEEIVSTSNKLYDWFIASKEQMKDTIVQSVIEQFKQRSKVGIKKYNKTLDRTDLTRLEWLQHAQEEAMDMILYLEKLKQYEK
jgi:histidinol dehydrogenase